MFLNWISTLGLNWLINRSLLGAITLMNWGMNFFFNQLTFGID